MSQIYKYKFKLTALIFTTFIYHTNDFFQGNNFLTLNICLAEDPVFIDSIIASVDNFPITLSDLVKKTKKKLSLKEAATDLDARKALDQMINEKVIEIESDKRKLNAGQDEIDEYISEVIKKNGISKDEFTQALKTEGQTIDEYKHFVKMEVLKSKLSSILLRGSISVTDDELQKYIQDHPNKIAGSSKIELKRIFLSKDKISSEQAIAKLTKAKAYVDEEEESFEEIAKEISNGSEAKDGGTLGTVNEGDLSPEIFDAIFSLPEKSVSKVVQNDDGYQIFYVAKRYKNESSDKERKMYETSIRKELEQEKLQNKTSSFFTEDILKDHFIDRKI